MVSSNQSSPDRWLTKKAVVVTVAIWFLVLFATRTRFAMDVVSSSLLVNLFVTGTFLVLIVSFHRLTLKKELLILFGALLAYAMLLVVWEDLPRQNILQFFLSTKLIFVYLAARLVPLSRRKFYWLSFSRIILVLLLVSLPFAVLDFLAPNMLFELAKDGRGVGGVSVGSIFASRVLYSEFLLFVLILLVSIPEGAHNRYFPVLRQLRPVVLITILVLLFLTYSRKEMLIGLVILLIEYGRSMRLRPAWVVKAIIAVALSVAVVGFFFAFRNLFLENFTEDYVRFKILVSAWEIFSDRFPLGTGPGTFGTGMSKGYTAVYEEFQVPSAVTGYSGNYDGPIFDLFFISFFAEYGLGALALFALFLHPFRTPALTEMNDVIDVGRFRIYLALLVFGAGFFVPIMGNLIGLISLLSLGLLANRRSA